MNDTHTLTVTLDEDKYKILCWDAENCGLTPEERATKILKGHLILTETYMLLAKLDEERAKAITD